MDTTLTKDARGFVSGVMTYLRGDSRSKQAAPKVQAFLGKVTEQARKEKMAHIESSVALTQMEKLAIEKMLAKLIGHDVSLICTISPDLLGGMRVQVGDWIVDTSLAMQLESMAAALKQ